MESLLVQDLQIKSFMLGYAPTVGLVLRVELLKLYEEKEKFKRREKGGTFDILFGKGGIVFISGGKGEIAQF